MCTKEDRDEIALAEPSAMLYMMDLHAGILNGSSNYVYQHVAGSNELTQVVKQAAGGEYRFLCCLNKGNHPNQYLRVSRVKNNNITTHVNSTT